MVETPADLPPLIGEAPSFSEMLEQVSRVAPLDRPVLVVGERGTGKEHIAARLHFLSRRWERPFVKLNCAALAENLLESELFGHEAGAFTGAVRRRLGRFELADTGTLFLDEIANAGLAVQEKVLRAVEYGEFERLGSERSQSVDVRIIGATNVDLPAAADAGTFRHDLLDRLSFDVVTIPPLRARREDIPLLANHFGRAMARELDWPDFAGFSDDAIAAMLAYEWPGNVRELKNVAARAVYRAGGSGEPVARIVFDPFGSPYRIKDKANGPAEPAPRAATEHAGATLPDASQPLDIRAVLADQERRLLAQAMAANRYNQRATARHVGLSYHQLRNALRKHGLLGEPVIKK
ncbi:MAG: phage shock protein operon transcriptional activator [Alphaproteobacteria bacterium]